MDNKINNIKLLLGDDKIENIKSVLKEKPKIKATHKCKKNCKKERCKNHRFTCKKFTFNDKNIRPIIDDITENVNNNDTSIK